VSDRTEQPTARRLRKAREEGDSGASPYAAQAAAFAAAVAVLPSAVRALVARSSDELRGAISHAAHPGDVAHLVDAWSTATGVIGVALPVLAAASLAGGAAYVVQTGGVFASSRVAPQLDRLDPVAGLGRLLSAERLFGVLRALVAAVALAALAAAELRAHVVDLARVAGRIGWLGPVVAGLTVTFAWRAAVVGLAIGLVDVVVTRRAWLGRLRMTKAEVRRDHKDAEGDPLVKAARERAYAEMLQGVTIANVQRATVVVVNPTHLACALRYQAGDGDEAGDEAPVVVSSGEGDLAARIIEAARAWGIPIVRDVPLARALVELEVGAEIPEALYEAVAEILRDLSEDGTRGP
jgi:flagellar biosynthesis protein FlhB